MTTFSFTPDSPAAAGYRMPAEWEPHAATWLSWPRPDGISFPDSYDHILPVLARMVDALASSEQVCINVGTPGLEDLARRALSHVSNDHVRYVRIPTNEPWCRDHGPIFVTREEPPCLAVTDWEYNAWGCKYPPFDLDTNVPTLVAELLDLPVYYPGMVLEGGSIDVNGSGTLLTTESCLLNPNRNPHLTKSQIEHKLCDFLGVRKVLWLGEGIEGDDTDGHVDDLTRFVDPTTVVTVVEDDPFDANHKPLAENFTRLQSCFTAEGHPLRVIPLPMPRRIEREGMRLPASYANFYIANSVVLLPVFQDANDSVAIERLEAVFPDRRVVPIDCTELIWGLGAFHCLTQQQPCFSKKSGG
ncbi:MAG: agmatine deiminase family protein [Verrucomicrobiia bacterium]